MFKPSVRSHIALLTLFLMIMSTMLACTTSNTKRNSASVVDFLFPDTQNPVADVGVPVLTLPLRIGIAFVPSKVNSNTMLTEKKKMELMQNVADHFSKQTFVKSIELIPTNYLKVKGGFSNLDQIKTMYGIDVIALISYDQVQFIDQDFLSLTYWTIIGAYIVPGEKNDTNTMLDTVIFDIKSRKMLFRAPGSNQIKGRTTPINLSEQLRQDSETSFKEASKVMITNLDQQLMQFKDKLKQLPDEYKVIKTPEYQSRGGGKIDYLWLLLLACFATVFIWCQKTKSHR